MNAPSPVEPTPSGTPPGNRVPDTAAEPVHSVAFKPSLDGGQLASASRSKKGRAWILAAVLVLLVAAGGWILHHLHQHPVVPQAPVTPQPSPETPAETGTTATPPPGIPVEPEPPVPQAATVPEAVTPEENTPPSPTPVPEDDISDEPGEQVPTSEKVSDDAPAQPDPTRQKFQELLSRGLAALHSGQYRQARDTLLEASAIDPQSDDVREALYQVDQALKLEQLDRLQGLAADAERNGQWPKALEMYLAALKIDPNVGFAMQGRQRTMRRITIDRRIDFFLTQPEKLYDGRHLENAIQLLMDAGRVEPRDADLEANLSKLDQLVTAAQTPVPVILTSDDLTDVAVYKVGRLGRFETHDLQLRPGPYTVVGVRDGYRDVRLNFTAKPGAGPLTLRVVCIEEIR